MFIVPISSFFSDSTRDSTREPMCLEYDNPSSGMIDIMLLSYYFNDPSSGMIDIMLLC